MACISYFMDGSSLYEDVKPYVYYGPDAGFPRDNIIKKEAALSLTDVRTIPDGKPTVHSHGFGFIEHKSKELPNVTDDATAKPYAAEMAELLKDLLGATTVVPLHARLRTTVAEHGTQAHIDTTMFDAWGRIAALITPEERELVLAGKYRARIMNLWRPILHPAEDCPLAMLDPTSIDYEGDGLAVDQVGPGFRAETVYLKHNSNHRWYWMSNMTPDDAVVFTQYDTHPPNGRFNHVGHTAFLNPNARPGCPPRQSIETRFAVLDPAPYQKSTTLADPAPPESRKQPWKDYVNVSEKPAVWKNSSRFAGEDTEARA